MSGTGRPLVSIILPTFNGAKLIRRSIESCLRQTHQNIELIIVDDCSTDETAGIIRSFDDPRIRYFRNTSNQRLPRSLNIGFSHARGEYLTWTSDDNEYYPAAIETMLRHLREDASVDFVYADYIGRYLDTGETQERKLPEKLDLERTNCIGACFLYTRRVYEVVGGYDPNCEWVEDYDYWIRVTKAVKARHVPQFLYIYGEHRHSLKGSRFLGIKLIEKALKYRYRYATLPELAESMGSFMLNAFDRRDSFKQFRVLWFQTARRIFGMSFLLGVLFLVLHFYFYPLRMVSRIIRNALLPFRRVRAKRQAARLTEGLGTNVKKRNILCAIPSMTIGGSEKVVLSIAQALNQEGFCFHLVATKNTDYSWQEQFRAHFRNVIVLNPVQEDSFYEYFYSALIEALNIDVLLISNSVVAYQCVPGLRRAFPHLKVVDLLHAEGWAGTSDELLWAASYIDRRVCISDHLKRHMASKYRSSSKVNGCHSGHLTTIHNGVDLAHFSAQHSAKGRFKLRFGLKGDVKLISFIGRFSVEKDPILFIDIAKSLTENGAHGRIKFVMAGDGYYSEQVKAKIREYGMESDFILTGMLDNVRELLADTHVLLVVSKTEGMPLVVNEALAMNVPVIGTDVGALHEIVKDGMNGYLVPLNENTKGAFVGKIQALLSDASLYDHVSANTRKPLLEEFSMPAMSARYKRMFDGLFMDMPAPESGDPAVME